MADPTSHHHDHDADEVLERLLPALAFLGVGLMAGAVLAVACLWAWLSGAL